MTLLLQAAGDRQPDRHRTCVVGGGEANGTVAPGFVDSLIAEAPERHDNHVEVSDPARDFVDERRMPSRVVGIEGQRGDGTSACAAKGRGNVIEDVEMTAGQDHGCASRPGEAPGDGHSEIGATPEHQNRLDVSDGILHGPSIQAMA